MMKELFQAVHDGDLESVKKLLKGGSPNYVDMDEWSLMHIAAYHGHVPMMQYFYEHGANLALVTAGGKTIADVAKHGPAEDWISEHSSAHSSLTGSTVSGSSSLF